MLSASQTGALERFWTKSGVPVKGAGGSLAKRQGLVLSPTKKLTQIGVQSSESTERCSL